MVTLLLLASVVLTGTVRDGPRGHPVPRAKVHVETSRYPPAKWDAVADDAGDYRIELPDLPLSVAIWAEADGYVTPEMDKHLYHVFRDATTDLKIDVVIPRAARIHGLIVDGTAMQPIVGVPVELLNSHWWRGKRSMGPFHPAVNATSGAGGSFELGNVPPGDYALLLGPSPSPQAAGSASAVKQGYRRTVFPEGADQGKTFSVQAGVDVDLGTIRLRREALYTLSGRLDATCDSSTQRFVTLEPRQRLSSGGIATTMARCGDDFTFVNVGPASYRVTATTEVRHPFIGAVQVLDVGEADATVTLAPQPAITIQGQEEWPAGAEKALANSHWSLNPRAVDGGGQIAFGDIYRTPGPDGRFKLLAVVGRQYYFDEFFYNRPPAPGFYIKEISYNGTDAFLGFAPDPNASRQEVEVVLSDQPARLEGSVRKGQSRAMRTQVVLVPWPAMMVDGFPLNMSDYTDMEGKFVLTDLRPGTYRIIACGRNTSRLQEPNVLMNLMQGASEIVLQEGQTLTLTLDRVEL